MEIKLGFVGFGNMAQAIAKGLIGAGVLPGSQMYACAAHFDKLQHTAGDLGVHPVATAQEVVERSDWVILAVKPYLIEQVVAPVAQLLAGKVVVSVAAGWTLERYRQILPENAHCICTVPNTPVAVGEGIFVCEQSHSLSEQEFAQFEQLFSPIALIEMIDTNHLSAAGTLSGCTPAFTAMYLEALGDAGVKYGLTALPPTASPPRCSAAPASSTCRPHPSRGNEGRGLLAGRHHHPRRLRAGKGGLPRGGHRGHRRDRRKIVHPIVERQKNLLLLFCANILTFIDLCAILISINIDGR